MASHMDNYVLEFIRTVHTDIRRVLGTFAQSKQVPTIHSYESLSANPTSNIAAYRSVINSANNAASPHEFWEISLSKLRDLGWVHGSQFNYMNRTAPFLLPFDELPEFNQLDIAIEYFFFRVQIFLDDYDYIMLRYFAEVAHALNNAVRYVQGDPVQEFTMERLDSLMRVIFDSFHNHDKTDTWPTPEEQHILWMESKKQDGWIHGNVLDPEAKTHPSLVDFDELSDLEQIKDYFMLHIIMVAYSFDKKVTNFDG